MKIRNSNIVFDMPDGNISKRLTSENSITWFTMNGTFKKIEDKWYICEDMNFTECEEPEIEKVFKAMQLW
jgi:hypothetical protein